jgi:hypothetical protein
MGKKKEPGVEGVLARLDPERRGLVDALRSIVKQTVPEVKETVKWGNITYMFCGENLAWIVIYSDHVDLGFFRGTELNSKMLEGTGKNMRHIKMRTITDINQAGITMLLEKSAELEKTQE